MRIVLLYNELDKEDVRQVCRELRGNGFSPWFAGDEIHAFGDLFEQIGAQMAAAQAVIFFVGSRGLGKFQRNIELETALWRQRSGRGGFAIIVVAIDADAPIPAELAAFPRIAFDAAHSPAALAVSIGRLVTDETVA